MPVIVKETEGGTYTPHPEGQYPARCIDVVDMGWQATDFGPKYKIRLVFYCGQTEQREYDGEKRTVPLTVVGFFTASLHEKSNLRAFCRSWRGRDFQGDELKDGFDFERMLNAPAFIQVEQKTVGTKTYANIASIMKLPEGMTAPDSPSEYQRVCEREGWDGPAPHPDMSAPDMSEPVPEDTTDYNAPKDDLPF